MKKPVENYDFNIYLWNWGNITEFDNNDEVNYELSVEQEFREVYVVPSRDTASLIPFSDLVEVDVKAEDEYVGSSVVPDGELAILLNLLVLEVS